MILEISNLKEIEENSKNQLSNNQLRKQKNLEHFLKIKANIIDLFLVHNDLLIDGQLLTKSNSEPNFNKYRNHQKNKLIQNKNEVKIKNLNLQEENILNGEKNSKKIKNKHKAFNIECNMYLYNSESNDGIERNKYHRKSLYSKEKKTKILNNYKLNINKNLFSNDINIENNKKINIFENNINKIKNIEKSKIKIYKNNSTNLEEPSSINSSKDDNSIKNNKNNKGKSFYSSSSFGKNFILKSKVCKSTKNNENKYYKNNAYSDENPIIEYYIGKDLGNFYLVTDKKSQEELEGINYMNFFPMNEKEIKNKDKDIMSCIYIDNKIQKFPKDENNNTTKDNNKKMEEDNNLFNFNDFNKTNSFGLAENTDNKFEFQKLNNLNLNDDLIEDNKDNDINKENQINNNINIDNVIRNSEKDNIYNKLNNNIPIENNYYNVNNNINLDSNINNNISNNNNYLPLKSIHKSNDENNFEFPMNKKKKMVNLLNNGNGNNTINILNKLNINEDINIKLPLSLFNSNFDIGNMNLKEFKLNPEILDELSNLKKINLNPNYFQTSDNQSSENYFNDLSKDVNMTYNNRHNANCSIDNIGSINMFPLNKTFYEYTEDELILYAIPLIKDQSGCRFLQDKIKNNQYFGNEKLFPKLKSNIKELACDPFGNYFLQVLIEILNYDNLNELLNLVKKEFTNICICPHGTRVIQKIIERIATIPDLINKFINNININDLSIICQSAYGNHILQKFLITIHNLESTKFIFDYIYNNFMEIAETKHGVCVIQKCVSEGNEIQRKKLYDLILKNFDKLIKDQFANYLIQYILINTKSKGQFLEIIPLIKKIKDNLLDYCKSKFSANVIEKCFENNENYIKEHILESLLNRYKDNIIEILLDQYGIYIIQKALKLNSIYKKKLCDIINQKENELRNININEFKYKGIIKIINSIKELAVIFSKVRSYNNSKSYNYNNIAANNYYSNEVEHRNNNRGKKKRGRKHLRGSNSKY